MPVPSALFPGALPVYRVLTADVTGWLLLVLLIAGAIVLNILHLANRQV
jgi:hypothetical protein